MRFAGAFHAAPGGLLIEKGQGPMLDGGAVLNAVGQRQRYYMFHVKHGARESKQLFHVKQTAGDKQQFADVSRETHSRERRKPANVSRETMQACKGGRGLIEY